MKYKISELLGQLIDEFTIDGHQYQVELDAFIKLDPHAIITTNYDTLLETLFSNRTVILDVGIKQAEHRYSLEALELLVKVQNHQDYYVTTEKGEILHPHQVVEGMVIR